MNAETIIKDRKSWGEDVVAREIPFHEVLFIFRDGKAGFMEFMKLLHRYIPIVIGSYGKETFNVKIVRKQADISLLAIMVIHFAKNGKFNLYKYPQMGEYFMLMVICKIVGVASNPRSLSSSYTTVKHRIKTGFWNNNPRFKDILTDLDFIK